MFNPLRWLSPFPQFLLCQECNINMKRSHNAVRCTLKTDVSLWELQLEKLLQIIGRLLHN